MKISNVDLYNYPYLFPNYDLLIDFSYLFYFSVFLLTAAVGSTYIYKLQVSADEFPTTSLKDYVDKFFPWMLTISGGLAVIMLIFSGYLYVTSAGSVDQINKAKEYIVGALSGLVFLVLAGLIYSTLRT